MRNRPLRRLRRRDCLAAAGAFLLAALVPQSWRDDAVRKTYAKVRDAIFEREGVQR